MTAADALADLFDSPTDETDQSPPRGPWAARLDALRDFAEPIADQPRVAVEEVGRYFGAGYALIPLNPWNARDARGAERGKSPRDGGWRETVYPQGNVTSAAHQGFNFGVRLRDADLVIDYDPRADVSGDALDKLAARLGFDLSLAPTVRTGGGGLHFYFSKPAGSRVRNSLPDFPGVEFKSLGRQVVGAGSVHPSGARYEWLATNSIELLGAPEAPASLLAAIEKREVAAGVADGPAEIDAEGLEFCLAQLRPEDFREHDEWLRLMMASHSGTRGAGRDAFIKWSTSDPRYAGHAGVIAERWASLSDKPGGVTVGTLYWHVLQAGGALPRASAVADFEEIAAEEPAPTVEATAEPRPIPHVSVEGQLSEIQAAIGRAVLAANSPPRLFEQGGEIVAVLDAGDEGNEEGEATLRRLTVSAFRSRAARAAHYYRPTKDGRAVAKLSKDAAECGMQWIAQRLGDRGEGLPSIRGVARSPLARADGSILSGVGYDPATRLYAASEGAGNLDVPERPTGAQVDAARGALLDVLADFPFADEASRAHALGALLSLLARELIRGPVPLFAIDAPAPGTGKTLLARALALIALGREPNALPLPRDEEEWRKRVLSLLLSGRDFAVLDNAEGELRSPSLCAALTSTSWEDRVLGQSATRAVPIRLQWWATGNNLRLTGDLTRRVAWCRLDAETARPDQRSGFRHADLISWVRAERPRLLSAAFTLLRAWIASDRPSPSASAPLIGGFEEWRRVIGGTLAVAGVSGFLANRADLFATMDEEGAAWAGFLAAWSEALGSKPAALRELPDPVLRLVPEAIGEPLDRGFSKRLGEALRKRVGRRHALAGGGEVWVERAESGAQGGIARWIVRRS